MEGEMVSLVFIGLNDVDVLIIAGLRRIGKGELRHWRKRPLAPHLTRANAADWLHPWGRTFPACTIAVVVWRLRLAAAFAQPKTAHYRRFHIGDLYGHGIKPADDVGAHTLALRVTRMPLSARYFSAGLSSLMHFAEVST